MKVLQLCAVDITVKSFLMPLIKRLQDEGHEVHVACAKGSAWDELCHLGLTLRSVPIRRSLNPLSAVRAIFSIMKLIRAEKYEMVHVHTPVAALVGRIAARLCGVSFIVYTVHGFYFHERMPKFKRNVLWMLEKFTGGFTDLMITVSDEDRVTAIQTRIISPEKVVTACNGVDTEDKFNPERYDALGKEQFKKSLGMSPDIKIILFVGRMVAEKGVPELVRSFSKLHDPSYRLVMIGGLADGDRDTDTWTWLQEQQCIDSRIVLMGQRADVPRFLSIADLFVLPSHREGMPVSLMEAMAMGIPAIATNIRGCREAVVDRETGRLVPVSSELDLTRELYELLENETLRATYGKASRERAELLFNRNIVLDVQMNAIRNMIMN